MLTGTSDVTLNQETLNIRNEQSGNKSINYRLGTSINHAGFGLTSTRENIDDSQFWCNEYGIPINNLDCSIPSVPTLLGIASSSSEDVGGGGGAAAIQVSGLNFAYNPQDEIIVMNGTTEVNSVKEYIAVNSAVVVATGVTGWNVGTIWIGSDANDYTGSAGTGVGDVGTPDTNVYRTIGVSIVDNKGMGVSANSTYTLQAGVFGVPLNFKCSTDATLSKPLYVRGIFKPFGLGELTIGNLIFDGSQEFTFDGFPGFDEKTSIIIRSRAKTSTTVDSAVVFWEWNTVKKNNF